MCLTIRSSLAAFALAACAVPAFAAPPSIGGCQILPSNNYWNTPVDTLPVHPLSATWVNSIGANTRLHPDWGNNLADNFGIPFDVVPGTQPNVPILFNPIDSAEDESDPGPYPIPPNAQVEGGLASGGDRHVLVIENTNCRLYELFSAYPQNGGAQWEVYSSAVFDLNSNALRPSGWTSADAAGYTILPGLVRWEEIAAGEINHAIRFTAAAIFGQNASGQKQFIWPARHWSSNSTVATQPPMGARFRLKASFDVSGFHPTVQVLLRAFKKYGIFLADRGSNWYFSGTSNTNFPDAFFTQLKNSSLIKGSDFEAVDTLLLQINPNTAQAVQPPGAPTGFGVTAGNAQATFSFTPPGDSGGKPVLDYTVTCNPGARTSTAIASPIVLTGLTNGVALTCSVAARNLVFSSTPSTTVNVTPGQGVLSAPVTIEGYNNPVGGGVTIPITVTNTGSGNTSALNVNLSGPGVAPYSQTSTCSGQSLIPGGSCTVDLTFSPLAIGVYVVSLNISGATTSPATVAITMGAIDTPGAPVIGNAVAGNGQAWVFFSPPASDGGSPITFYRAMCLPASGSVMADGNSSPILVTGMSNNVSYSCYVLAANMAGNGPLSSVVTVTPSAAPSFGLIGVQSRKTHTGMGEFNLPVNSPVDIAGRITVEPRSIGSNHRVVFQFNGPVNNPGSVTAVDAASVTVGTATPSFLGNEVIVTLTGIPDNQRVKVTLANVNNAGINAEASLGFLVGDVNGTGKVNASDISSVKTRLNLPASLANFKFDLDTNGTVGQQDISAVKARSGIVLP